VFYDDYYPEKLWGQDLVVLFDEVYLKKFSTAWFLVPANTERMWTNHERQSAQARALEEKGREYILLIQTEPAELPRMPPTIGYLSLEQYSLEELTQILITKLGER